MNLRLAVPVLLLGLCCCSAKSDYEQLCVQTLPSETEPFDGQRAVFDSAAEEVSSRQARDGLHRLHGVAAESQAKVLREFLREAGVTKCPLADGLETRFAPAPVTGCIPGFLNRRCRLDAVPPGLAEAWAELPPSALRSLTVKKIDDRGLVEIGKLTDLTGLILEDAGQVSDLTPLHSLTRLDDLRIQGSAVKDLHALAGLNALSQLDLHDNAKLSSIAGLETANLRVVNLKGTAVRDIAVLNTASRLSTVYLPEGVPVEQQRALAAATHNLTFGR